jgi:NAD(P)-dependent dehydrogenase (short-subunit alcohol dehydrogenase family)
MRTQGGGAIVNCSSIGGVRGGPGRAAYHAAKHPIIGLTKSAAREFGSQGIRVNAVLPGTIDTPMVTEMISTGALDHADSVRSWRRDCTAIARRRRSHRDGRGDRWALRPEPETPAFRRPRDPGHSPGGGEGLSAWNRCR